MRSSRGPNYFRVYLKNDNFNMREYVARVLMMVCEVSESEATAIMMEANRDRWKNLALCGTWEEELAQHIYDGMRSAGLCAVIAPVGDEDDDQIEGDRPTYLDGSFIESEDLPRYYQ